MLDLSQFIGDAHLGDPTTDPDSWCENFKRWRDCLPLSSKTACVVLKAKVVSKHQVVITHIDQEWIAQGNGMPSSDKEWDKYFDHMIKLLPRCFRRNNDSSKESLSSAWERLEQGNLTVHEYAAEITAVADKFERLTPPIVKPVSERLAKFLTGIKPALRLHLTGSIRDCAVDDMDDQPAALVKFETLVQLASSYERWLEEAAAAERPRRGRGRFHPCDNAFPVGSGTNTESPPIDYTLCRSFASGRMCRYGRKCKRLHMAANEFIRHRLFGLQSKREQDLILEIDRSGATPGHPAMGGPPPRSVEAVTKSMSRPPSLTAEASSTEALKAQVQQLQEQIATLLIALGPDPPLTATPVTMDEVAHIPTTHAMQAHVPIAGPAMNDHVESSGPTEDVNLPMSRELPLAMSTAPESVDLPPEDELIRPITQITPCAHIPAFLGRQASTHFAMILETCNEAKRSLMSYRAFADYVAPQGYTLFPPPVDGLPLIARNGTQLSPVGCATLPVFFRKPGPRALADFELSVFVIGADSGFDNDLVLCVNDLRMLGMCLHLADGWVEFLNLEPARRIRLGTGLAIPAAQRRRPSEHDARTHPITATATLDVSHDTPFFANDTCSQFAD